MYDQTQMATIVTADGLITYLAIASPGTQSNMPNWQCKRIDDTVGTIITWADGDNKFDNIADNLITLTYL
jgi:hypothetical protein